MQVMSLLLEIGAKKTREEESPVLAVEALKTAFTNLYVVCVCGEDRSPSITQTLINEGLSVQLVHGGLQRLSRYIHDEKEFSGPENVELRKLYKRIVDEDRHDAQILILVSGQHVKEYEVVIKMLAANFAQAYLVIENMASNVLAHFRKPQDISSFLCKHRFYPTHHQDQGIRN